MLLAVGSARYWVGNSGGVRSRFDVEVALVGAVAALVSGCAKAGPVKMRLKRRTVWVFMILGDGVEDGDPYRVIEQCWLWNMEWHRPALCILHGEYMD